jgi:hypothetical protein
MPHDKEMEPTAQKTRRGSFPGVGRTITDHEDPSAGGRGRSGASGCRRGVRRQRWVLLRRSRVCCVPVRYGTAPGRTASTPCAKHRHRSGNSRARNTRASSVPGPRRSVRRRMDRGRLIHRDLSGHARRQYSAGSLRGAALRLRPEGPARVLPSTQSRHAESGS